MGLGPRQIVYSAESASVNVCAAFSSFESRSMRILRRGGRHRKTHGHTGNHENQSGRERIPDSIAQNRGHFWQELRRYFEARRGLEKVLRMSQFFQHSGWN